MHKIHVNVEVCTITDTRLGKLEKLPLSVVHVIIT